MTFFVGRTASPHGSARLDAAVAATLLAADIAGIVADVAADRVDAAGQIVGHASVAIGCAFAFWRWRRHHPVWLLAAVFVGLTIAAGVNDPPLLTQRTGVQFVLVMYAMASWSSHRRWAAILPVAIALLAAAGTAKDGKGLAEAVSVPVALVVAPWFAGYSALVRRQHLAGVETRLHRAETDRDERARLAVAEERSRIARELHDVVAHHLSLIGVQAGAARTTLGRDTEGTRDALSSIEGSSRDAVREMRHLLDVLGSPGDTEPLAPAPGLAEFGHLCDSYRAAGLLVHRTRSGSLDHLPALHALTMYRIAEEALTNISRHSTATSCTLHLHGDARSARVIVTDPGPPRPLGPRPAPPPGTGRGLIGMRQRVEMFAGTLTVGPVAAGPGPDGAAGNCSFVVDATICVEHR